MDGVSTDEIKDSIKEILNDIYTKVSYIHSKYEVDSQTGQIIGLLPSKDVDRANFSETHHEKFNGYNNFKKHEFLFYFLFILIIVLVICVILALIYLIFKKCRKKNETVRQDIEKTLDCEITRDLVKNEIKFMLEHNLKYKTNSLPNLSMINRALPTPPVVPRTVFLDLKPVPKKRTSIINRPFSNIYENISKLS